jgi:succinoglycan biosynthesis transport protein ExoP
VSDGSALAVPASGRHPGDSSQRVVTLADRWAAVRRRCWPALWVSLAVLLLASAGALFWPATYRSTGTILIEQQELPSDLVQSTITSYADQRIQVISQRVMTTDNLLGVIDRYKLYPKLRKNEPREVLLARMRKDINLQMISADVMDPRQGRATKANIAFALSYASGSPETAARVANELVSLYLDENVKSRKKQSADAENFLDDEANRLDKNIARLEAGLATFKDDHINTLPDQAIINKETLIRSEDELRDIDTQLRSLEQQSTYLDAQLAQLTPSSQVYTSTGERVLSPADRLKFLRTEYARVSGIYSPDHPDVLRIKREIEGLEHEAGQVDSSNDLQRQLRDARTQLAQLQERYAPDHPDVVRLQKQIETLNQALAAAPSSALPPATVGLPDNPAYIQVKAQRQATAAERESLSKKRAAVQDKIAVLEGRLAAAPGVQRDFDALARELDNEQIKYREVRQKQMAAKLSENLEDEQKGERFTLIDPPLPPQQPSSPNRPMLMALGLALALASGLGTVALLESRDDSVRNRRDLEWLLAVPPLAVLPLVRTRADRARQRWQRHIAWLGTVSVFALALVLTHLFYRPLDVLWAVAMRKISG